MPAASSPSGQGGPSATLLHDRRLVTILIAGGVMALVLVTVIHHSGAYFTSTSRSPGNEFAAAGMRISLSETGEIIRGAGLRPGSSRTGEQTVTNEGPRGRLRLEALDLDTGNRLAEVLEIRVRQSGPGHPPDVYDGPLTRMGRLDLGILGEGARRTWTITVTWPARADDPGLSGASTSLRFDWQLESEP